MSLSIIDNVHVVLSKTASALIFEDLTNVTDTSSLTNAVEYNQSFPVATTVVGMGQVGTGKFLYIKPTANVTAVFDGGAETHVFLAGKASRIWMNFSALSLTVSGSANIIQVVIAG